MSIELRPIDQQVIVITGATSGIGLVTARMAAERGARLVLAARTEEALRQLIEEIAAKGGMVETVVADVGIEEEVQAIARAAVDRFGGIDTWVNNAGVSIYGNVEDVPVDDMRRLFDTNVWGVVHGSRVAVPHLRQRGGGAIINIGSVLSDRAIAVQGIYSASKHAVKGFTEALRMELEHAGDPISVTLVKPSAIDTPYTRHAKNYMDVDAAVPPPVYAPDLVAEAILGAAERPVRDVFVGAGGASLALMGAVAPRITDRVMERIFIRQQQRDRPPRARDDNGLYRAAADLKERGDHDGITIESSPYTFAQVNPAKTGAVIAGVGLAGTLAWRAARGATRR